MMDTQKFMGIMSYYPTTFLKDENWLEYNYKIMSIVKEIMLRRQYNDYSKYFLYTSYKKIDLELTQLIKKTQKSLKTDELDFLQNLLNLIRNIKRFTYDNKTRTFPSCYAELSTTGLVNFIANINQLRKYKKVIEVNMLKTDQYLKLAENLWLEAEKYYYTKQ